ncbi:MAG: hypothetical protein ACPG32_15130 [Akkermansiaceae bacterium]
MKNFIHIVAIFIGVSLSALAKEQWVLKMNSDGAPSFVYEQANGKSLSFRKYYFESNKISDEIALQFQKDYPVLWKKANDSSGNMHNPRILPLRARFTEVLLKTPTLKKLDKLARKSGYTVFGAQHEKFHFMKRDGRMKVYAVIWLKLKKVAGQGAAADH